MEINFRLLQQVLVGHESILCVKIFNIQSINILKISMRDLILN